MKVSELLAALQKVQQVAGDLPIVLQHVEQDAETELLSIGLHINPSTGETSGSAVLEHGDAPPAPSPVQEAPAPPAE